MVCSGQKARLWFLFFLTFVALISLTFGFWLARKNSPYVIGEWLTNYTGGFVRRGFLGELILLTGHVTHIRFAWIVFIIQAVTYLLFLACVFHLSRGLRWTGLNWAILLSPATIAFIVLNAWSGYRKDILLAAVLALTLCLLESTRTSDAAFATAMSLLLPTLVLSHEASIVCFPYFFAAFATQRGTTRAVRILWLPAMLAALATIAAFLHPGNHAIAQAICSSVGGTLEPFGPPTSNVCSGSISWLQLTLPQARQVILPIIREDHYIPRYTLRAILTFAPILAALVLLYRCDKLHREVTVLARCAALGFAGTLVLCYTALDWGRWINMQAVCLMLLILVIDRRAPATNTSRQKSSLLYRTLAFCAVLVYATCWTLPAIGFTEDRQGYLDLARHLLYYARHPDESIKPAT